MQGAPEEVLARCSHAVGNGSGPPFPLTDASRSAVLREVEELGGSRALRCLALASRSMDTGLRQVGMQASWVLREAVASHPPAQKLHSSCIATGPSGKPAAGVSGLPCSQS